MLIVQKLIKKTDPIKGYWIFGIYSLIANALAFGAGWLYLTRGGTFLQILFVFFFFAIGLQFGASNIIPNIFNADILNELELQTGGRRLEQTISFTQSLFGTVMGMALRAKKLIEDNLFYTDGTPVKVVVNDGTIGGGAESVALPSPDRAGADMSQGASGTE